MPVSICIHGHFYQPPREDPWLGGMLCEASAAPMRHWNERILRESYAPLAWARRLDGEGRIADIINCYEWMSFNAGPTLLQWMRRDAPETLARMKEGDANSIARWGHGNALAQIYHHVIMPLASPEDRALEIRWAIDDFRFHFGRDPEGMWLSECAVDTPTLESLADQGVSFVILAPRQAKAVITGGEPVPVSEAGLDIGQPYRVPLPSGRTVTAVFYNGPLSQAIAFEGLLRDGEHFWQRVAGEARALGAAYSGPGSPLLTLATDGETYGHHFTFGEMALAHVLAQGYTERDGIRLTNIAAHIAANPPQRDIVLHEPSSWSCVHGVERWRSNCGCTDGGHPGWNQQWRAPLRAALHFARDGARAHYADAGTACFIDSASALMEYGTVLADPDQAGIFAEKRLVADPVARDRGWKLLAMQEQSLASLASCAWFFDDIGRIEPENALTFALRSLDLVCETGGPDLLPGMLDILADARSNQPELGDGRELFAKDVLPRRNGAAALCLLAWLRAAARHGKPEPGETYAENWPAARVALTPSQDEEDGVQIGEARVCAGFEASGSAFDWRIEPLSMAAPPDRGFISLANTTLRVRPRASGSRAPCHQAVAPQCAADDDARVGSFGRPLRDTVLHEFLEERERAARPAALAEAAHALSLMDVWHEAQHDLTLPEYWTPVLPYLPAAAMFAVELIDDNRERLRKVLERQLSDYARRLAEAVVRERLLEALDALNVLGATGAAPAHSGDRALARAVSTATLLLPGMDWWIVQNRLWELGPAAFPALAEALGFR